MSGEVEGTAATAAGRVTIVGEIDADGRVRGGVLGQHHHQPLCTREQIAPHLAADKFSQMKPPDCSQPTN